MLNSQRLMLGIFAQLFVFCTACAAVQLTADITMTMTFNGQQQPVVMVGKVYISGMKLRMELTGSKGTVVMIGDNNKTKRTYLDPQQKLFWYKIEEPPDEINDSYLLTIADKAVLGEESVGGYPCQKILYTRRDKMGTETRWYSRDLKIPIKFEETRKDLKTAPDGLAVVTEYKNIKAEAVADSLFEIPADYVEKPAK